MRIFTPKQQSKINNMHKYMRLKGWVSSSVFFYNVEVAACNKGGEALTKFKDWLDSSMSTIHTREMMEPYKETLKPKILPEKMSWSLEFFGHTEALDSATLRTERIYL